MTAMFEFFEAPVVPGFSIKEDMLTVRQEAALIADIDESGLSPFRFQQWTGKRLTRSYGWSYDFETGKFAPTDPLPDWLHAVRTQAARVAGLPAEALVQALVIRYDPGAGIGWHKDRPVFEHVVGISLGHVASLRLRRRTDRGFERAKVELPPRSIYHLSGEARDNWEHSIAPMEVPRWSITFRSLARA
ncbi:alkylated DNA repair dioxygenase AlkB [Sphingobium sp. B11D3B]|uniref:alpha-ketoglutarate-dependent dioxygenase AlkB n=1 Tax=Sphingobium sp. B11D3B TaxID=2940575 RepID=UPI0022266170|nr:alpha-ketoglutarate-dependent dioxygenase AlkB [Sphingobium sp. B11D3B]MCW2387151.1 alkylated DNA repair dioxygenase AlkB [Sphingobium sp. B11D3B]